MFLDYMFVIKQHPLSTYPNFINGFFSYLTLFVILVLLKLNIFDLYEKELEFEDNLSP